MIGRLVAAMGSSPGGTASLHGRRSPRPHPGSIVAHPDATALLPAPIDAAWRFGDGEVQTEAAEIARSADGATAVYLWQTSRAHYRWEHASDETVVILEGHVHLRDEDAPASDERRLGPGDVAFFPAGARTVWFVPDHLRKVSTLTRPLPGPLARALNGLRFAKRLAAVAARTASRVSQSRRPRSTLMDGSRRS
jgi:uncharacterized protein